MTSKGPPPKKPARADRHGAPPSQTGAPSSRSGGPPSRGGGGPPTRPGSHGPRSNSPHARPGGPGGLGPRGQKPRERAFHICGMPAVAALFQHRPEAVERLFFDDRQKTVTGDYCHLLASHRKTYRLVESDELTKIAGGAMHGGVVAVAAPRPMRALDTADAAAWAKAKEPLLILDGIGNPHNLGAIVRTAAFFGLKRVLISDHSSQAQPSEAAYRVAEGGFETVEIFTVSGLPRALNRLADHYRIVGTALEKAVPFTGFAPGKPVALVLGNEESGLHPATLAACAQRVVLPARGSVQSLNVAATAAIFIHALTLGTP